MLISLAVRLLIPDTTASTARRALQAHGLDQLTELRREVGWSFAVEAEQPALVAALAERLIAADVLVNQNKERARWWTGPLEAATPPLAAGSAGPRWAAVLVEDRDDGEIARMQRLLTSRLGFTDLEVARHGTLWWVGAPAAEDAVARLAAERLLANPHGQTYTVLSGGPSPVGGGPPHAG